MKSMKYGVFGGVACITTICAATIIGSGCQVTESQMKVIANQAGLISAVTWIGYDNPSDEAKAQVVGVVTLIKSNAVLVTSGKTYTEVLLPLVNVYVDTKVEKQYRPACKVAASSLLGAIDLMFAMHPEYKEKEQLTLSIVNSFCDGAITGLSLSSDSPELKAVRPNAIYRAARQYDI